MNPFALVSSALEGLSWKIEKKSLFKEHAMEFTAATLLFCVLFTAPLWLIAPTEYLRLDITGLIFASSIAGSLSLLAIAKGLRHISLHMASPFFGLTPIIAAGSGFFFGETLTYMQWAGMGLLSIGLFSIEGHERWTEPFRHMDKLKYIWFIITGLFLFTASAYIDHEIVGSQDNAYYGLPLTAYLPLYFFFCGVILVVMMLLFHDGFKGIGKGMENNTKWLCAVAILTILAKLTMLMALSFPGVIASLVIAVQKTSWAFGSASEKSFWHGEGALRRLCALCILILGIVILFT